MGMGPGLCENTHGLPMSHTMRNKLIIAFQDFEVTILVELVSQWCQAVELWEENSNAPNPFKAEK